ncbi:MULTISPECIES: amidohydrolase family protein [unclassified Rhodococcus (in: high G+C Gram-positive bacteria)]|uniref:amidohydrolase family protein n=1 Tax=unclassified Rhodococcus (in: high G+C Gram-positive bacteria) TaxID=192944 RepID=UPI0002E3EAFD|nr:amidohydrolase family protein [Rhodococcus sp. DK17]
MKPDNGGPGTAPAGVHAPIREQWLGLVDEPLVPSGMPIVDAHHHLWDRPRNQYLLPEYRADLDTVPAVAATVFVQCRSHYLPAGPEALKPVGEVRFARAVAESAHRTRPNGPHVARGIVAGADLTLGDRLGGVLDVLDADAGGRLRGIRNQTAWHPDPRVTSSPFPPAPNKLLDSAFHGGARMLGTRGLSLDVWAYHTQLGQLRDLARACPDTTIVVDHLGGPLGVGPYADTRTSAFADWARDLAAVAACPNTVLKLSGAGMRVFGFAFDQRSRPPTSDELAAALTPYLDLALTLFGPQRCMFASNFPVDKGMFSYRTLWNTYAKAAAPLNQSEQEHLFHGTADAVYRLGLPLSSTHASTQEHVHG